MRETELSKKNFYFIFIAKICFLWDFILILFDFIYFLIPNSYFFEAVGINERGVFCRCITVDH